MATEARLQELYNKGRQSSFTLPPNITSKKTLSAEGYHIQTFSHQDLGEIGRIIILPHGSESQICCEVIGDPDDPMTQRKMDIFSPIAKQTTDAIDKILGKSVTCATPYSLKESGDVIESKVFPCDICHEITAMMINAHDAQTQGDLENYATKMYAKVKELNVPTWVVGREQEITLANGTKTGEAIIMKIWPNKENPLILEAELFNEAIDRLMDDHCRAKNK